MANVNVNLLDKDGNTLLPSSIISQIQNLSDTLNTFVTKVNGKGLSTNDLTDVLLAKLNSLENYDDSAISSEITTLTNRLNTLTSGNASTAIDNFNEIVEFLNNITDSSTLSGIISGINTAINNVQNNLNSEITRASNLSNDLNVDKLYPLTAGNYYTLATAISAITDSNLKKTGVKITFQSASGIFETWQLKTAISGWNTQTNWVLSPSREEIDANTSDIAALKMGTGYYCIAGWDPNNLSPTPTTTKGNQTWLRNLSHVYLFDMTQNANNVMMPIGELQRANWLRYVDGTFAPTVGITESMRATCDVALYLDSAHTNLYSAAGAFNAATFYNTYGMTQKLYDASGNEVRILRPWETTSTNYSIGIGYSEKVWLIDGLGDSGVYWQGLSQHDITWDGVAGVSLERTALFPSPITTYGNKARCFFYLYNTGDNNTSSHAGVNNLCTLFSNTGRTYPRVSDMSQLTNVTYARANNPTVSNSYPVSEGGYHALNANISRLEVLFGTRYLHNPLLFGSGISSNDSCNSESDFLANGGLKYRKIGDTAYSYCSYNQQPNIYIDASGHKADASNLLNSYYPKEQCLESQLAASFAKEIGVAANTNFTFYGSTYQYGNVTGVLGLSDGIMNAIVYKQMTSNIQGYDSGGNATYYELITNLRMSLFEGLNLSGDIWAYWGGGYEQVGTNVSTAQGHNGDKVDIYLQTDQKKWIAETDVSKTNLGIFDFESQYEKIAEVNTLGNSYAKTRIPLTPWKSVNGGSLSTGQCYQQFEDNYWSNVINTRVRLAALFRGNAFYGVCSPRCIYASSACSNVVQSIGGSAQVLIG